MAWIYQGLVALLFCGLLVGIPAHSQQSGPSAWVKLCEKTMVPRKDGLGKDIKEEKNFCLTFHERLDGNSGRVLVSMAIRDPDGMGKNILIVTVPFGMALPAGMKTAVYTKDLWAKEMKNEKVDYTQLKIIDIPYSLCQQAGCTAEMEATKELIESMRTGGGMMVYVIDALGQPIGFRVPLEGFTQAHSGPPTDSKVYTQARSQLMQQIRQRQAELLKKYQEEQKQKEKQGGQQRPPPAAVVPAPATQPIRRVALVIGNSAYRQVPRLDNPARDARGVAESFRRIGFNDVTEMYDLSLNDLVAALRTFEKRASDSD